MQRTYNRSKLVAYITDQVESGRNTDQLVREVAAYLIDQNKVSDIESILRDVQELRAQKYGNVELTATSAHEIDKSLLTRVETLAKGQYPNAKRVTVHQEIDPEVVGGANLAFPHASLDLTIRAKLNQLREAIS